MSAVHATRVREDASVRVDTDRPIGGQAVLEGVMMRGVRTWSVAARAREIAHALEHDHI